MVYKPAPRQLPAWRRISSRRKNGREPFLTSRSDDPQGGRQGWRGIKNGREPFLTSHSDDPQGGRQGWRGIKNGREPFVTSRSDGPGGGRQGWRAIKKAPMCRGWKSDAPLCGAHGERVSDQRGQG